MTGIQSEVRTAFPGSCYGGARVQLQRHFREMGGESSILVLAEVVTWDNLVR